MAYWGAEARSLAYEQVQEITPERKVAPSFELIEGGGLDARARRGIDAAFVARARMVLVVVLAVIILGCARIGLSCATVSQLREARTLRLAANELAEANDALEVERSADASAARIVAIATQTYGMTLASDHETLQLSTADEVSAQDGAEQVLDADTSLDAGELVVAQAEAASEAGR